MAEIRTRDGALLRYDDVGAGRPVLFVHGWAMAASLFGELADTLRPEFRVIVPNLRGHGQSPPEGAPEIDVLGRDLADLVAALDLDDVLAVGWSMGAMALWSACEDAAFCETLTGLVVIDMSPRLANDDGWRFGLADGRDLAATLAAAGPMRADWPRAVARFVPRIVAAGEENARAPLVEAMSTVALAQDAEFMAALWESMARQDFRTALGRLPAPTLVVYGEKSRLYAPAASRFIARAAADGRAVSFANSGHAPHFEEPRRFVESLRSFAASTSKNQAGPARAGSVR